MDPPTAAAAPDVVASGVQNPETLPTAPPIKRALETNLGPLTTTFTPPAGCDGLLVRTVISGDREQFYVGYGETCTVGDDGETSTFFPASCYPGDFIDWFSAPGRNIPDRNDPAAYSPGLVCPLGYEIACSMTRSGGSLTLSESSATDIDELWDILEDGETAIGCCPTRYTCKSDTYDLCTSQVTAGRDVVATTYDSECKPSTTSWDIRLAWAAFMDDHIAEAPRVILIPPDPTAPTSFDDQGSGDDDGGSSSGLSRDGKIAIGVLVPAFVLLAAAVLWLVLRRKTRSGGLGKWFSWRKGLDSKDSGRGPAGGDGSALGKPELQGSPTAGATGLHSAAYEKHEMGNSEPGVDRTSAVPSGGEISAVPAGRSRASELDSGNGRAELPS